MTFPFRAPVKNFAPEPAETPYRRAQAEWDARMGSAVLSARSWRRIAFAALAATALAVLGATAIALQQRTYVHVVEVDPQGQVLSVRAAERQWTPNEAADMIGRLRFVWRPLPFGCAYRSEEHTSELQSRENLVCRLLLEKKQKVQKETINSS